MLLMNLKLKQIGLIKYFTVLVKALNTLYNHEKKFEDIFETCRQKLPQTYYVTFLSQYLTFSIIIFSFAFKLLPYLF